MSDTKHPGGRPTKYKPEYCLAAEYMARSGMIDDEIADKLGVALSTVSLWKKEHPEFSDAISRGKTDIDDQVERALFTRAIGFEKEAVKIFMPAGKDDPVYAKYMAYYPPDAEAAFKWLKNRRPGKWRDRQEVQLETGPLEIRVTHETEGI